MFIGYLQDRKKLGFSCFNDIHSIKKLSRLKIVIASAGI